MQAAVPPAATRRKWLHRACETLSIIDAICEIARISFEAAVNSQTVTVDSLSRPNASSAITRH
eukprot:5916180-Pyramimonas_sp.AAC.1